MSKFEVVAWQRSVYRARVQIEATDAAAAEERALKMAHDGDLDMIECEDSFDPPHYAETWTVHDSGERSALRPARIYDTGE